MTIFICGHGLHVRACMHATCQWLWISSGCGFYTVRSHLFSISVSLSVSLSLDLSLVSETAANVQAHYVRHIQKAKVLGLSCGGVCALRERERESIQLRLPLVALQDVHRDFLPLQARREHYHGGR
jgi:hypothetical protein